MRPLDAAIGVFLLAVILCSAGTASAAAAYRLGPAHDSEPELLIPNPNATTGSCGVERWPVKTGTDPDAGQVDMTSSTPASVAQLAAIQPPASLPNDQRISPTETTSFTVDATLTKYKLEGDSDYHLVISDANGQTMIAEIPDPACVGVASPFMADIETARQLFDNRYAATDTFQPADIPVCLTGVGFFDFIHGQTGAAPNGIELHPVIALQFNPATCQGWANTTPPAAQFLAPSPPASATAGNRLQFRIQCTAGSNPLASWHLDFGDGSVPANGNLQGTASKAATASHAYIAAGSRFVATLSCLDTSGKASVPVTLAVAVKPQSASGRNGGSGTIGTSLLIALSLLMGLTARNRR